MKTSIKFFPAPHPSVFKVTHPIVTFTSAGDVYAEVESYVIAYRIGDVPGILQYSSPSVREIRKIEQVGPVVIDSDLLRMNPLITEILKPFKTFYEKWKNLHALESNWKTHKGNGNAVYHRLPKMDVVTTFDYMGNPFCLTTDDFEDLRKYGY